MTKLIITQNNKINYLLLSFFISSLCYSQNCYDTYDTSNNILTSNIFTPNYSSPFGAAPGFTGEYQMFIHDMDDWKYNASYKIEVDISHFENGVYFVSFENNQHSETQQIIKTK